MNHKERRAQRCRLLRKILAQYQEPCPWCPVKRPGKEVNMVPVQLPGSHGICKDCFEMIKEEIKKIKKK